MGNRNQTLAVGDLAPAIEAPSATGAPFSLSAHAGEWGVVFFYPMANTPG